MVDLIGGNMGEIGPVIFMAKSADTGQLSRQTRSFQADLRHDYELIEKGLSGLLSISMEHFVRPFSSSKRMDTF